MSNAPQFVVAQSPFITWPVTFWSPQEDGPEVEVTWPFRFRRPMAADIKRYREAKKRRLERESRDLQESIAEPLRKLTAEQRTEVIGQLDASVAAMVSEAPADPLTPEQREERLKTIFDPAAWREDLWRGWRTKTLVDAKGGFLDPDSNSDRDYILQTAGLEEAIERAIDEMMMGGRQKNSRPSLAS